MSAARTPRRPTGGRPWPPRSRCFPPSPGAKRSPGTRWRTPRSRWRCSTPTSATTDARSRAHLGATRDTRDRNRDRRVRRRHRDVRRLRATDRSRSRSHRTDHCAPTALAAGVTCSGRRQRHVRRRTDARTRARRPRAAGDRAAARAGRPPGPCPACTRHAHSGVPRRVRVVARRARRRASPCTRPTR